MRAVLRRSGEAKGARRMMRVLMFGGYWVLDKGEDFQFEESAGWGVKRGEELAIGFTINAILRTAEVPSAIWQGETRKRSSAVLF